MLIKSVALHVSYLVSLVPREAGIRALQATDLAGVAERLVRLPGKRFPVDSSRHHSRRLLNEALVVGHP